MKRFLSSVCCALTLWLAMVVGVSQAQAQNLTVKFTFTDNTEQTFSGQNTLADAFAELSTVSKAVADVTEIKITSGRFNAADWNTIKSEKGNLGALSKFTITDDIAEVANIPAIAGTAPANGIFGTLSSLKEVYIAKIVNLGNLTFDGCNGLTKITLPAVTSIGNYALRSTAITEAYFPNATSVGNYAFRNTPIVSANMPKLTTVGTGAFLECTSLKVVNLPKVTTLPSKPFAASDLEEVNLASLPSLTENIFTPSKATLRKVNLASATALPEGCFKGFLALETVNIDGMQSITDPTLFNACTNLESVSMVRVTSIGTDATASHRIFTGLYKLKKLYLGTTPPTFSKASDPFASQNGASGIQPRFIIICASDGTPISDATTLATAKANYFAAADGDQTDELYWGWSIADAPYTIAATASPSEGGSVTGFGMYITGDNITLTATPAEGYRFLHWTDGVNDLGNENPYSFVASANADITAVFELIPTYNITATANPTEGGTVTGDGSYNHGESVTLTATANEGYHFVNWTEGGNVVSTNASYTFTADQVRTLVAQFELNSYTITATANPTEGGTVTGDGSYNHGESVTLTATANTGYRFIDWSNGEKASPYTFTATANLDITANFVPIEVNNITLDYTTLLRKVGETPVLITATIEPADALDKSLTWNSDDEAVATVTNGLVAFVGVGSTNITATATNGVLATCAVTVSPVTYAISVDANITNGSITPDKTEASANETITLTVTPDPNYQLVAGSLKVNGDASIVEPNGINQYKFSMPAEDVEVTAQFEQMGYIINVTANPAEGGVVSGAGIYSDGETITITATPNAGYTFKQWNDNNTESSRSVVVSGNADYIAEFEEIVLNTISLNPATLTIPSTSVLPYDIMVVFDPEDALNREFDWEISDQNVILNVSPYPSLISIAANNPGTATITVTSRANPNLVATCEVTVVDGDLPVQGVSLNETSLTLFEGRAFQLKATTDPVAASNQKMTWTCTDESVVTINASAYYCLVVAKSAGTATVTVKTEDGGYEASCEITVEALPSVESVALNSTAVTLEVAETHLLQATVLPAEANQGVTWTSNNEAVATVADGEISAVAVGTAIITATTDDGGFTAYCVVSVNDYTLPDAIASFEDLTLAKADTFWTGASNPDGLFTSFVSGTYRFVNTSGWGGTYWAGFAYTNTTATDAANWNTTNVGTGIDGSQNYGVAYYSSWDFPTGITVERTNTTDAKPVSGMYVTNTAQVIDVLNNGNAFARKFEQGDWFKLTATADNGNSLDFYLADFRSSDATEHYIVDSWEWFDLSPLGDVKTVSFTMSSSDVGAYGVNTPTYFAFDDFGGVAPTFTLTYTAGPNGTVEGQQSVTQVVSYGKNGDEVLAEAAPGYQFLRWSDGLSWGNGTRRDYNVKENINVTVEFVPVGTQLHYISYFASPGGSIKGQTSQRVADGQSSIEVKAVANNGYRFDKWNDGNEQAARFESDVHQDDFYTAYFIKQIRVDYMAAANGRIEGKTTQIVDRGVATEAVTAIANAGYRFVRWSDGVTEATRTDIIDLDIDDTTFVAQFELIRHILTISVLGDDAQPIAAAKVTLGGKEYTTDAKGVVVDTLLPKTYAYTVELSGYNTQTGEVNLVRDTLVKVILSKPSAPATGLFDNVIEHLSVYPNPTVGAVQVEANGTVLVYNAAGQLLQRVPAQGKVLIDLSNYPAGFYFVVVGKAKATIVKQ